MSFLELYTYCGDVQCLFNTDVHSFAIYLRTPERKAGNKPNVVVVKSDKKKTTVESKVEAPKVKKTTTVGADEFEGETRHEQAHVC